MANIELDDGSLIYYTEFDDYIKIDFIYTETHQGEKLLSLIPKGKSVLAEVSEKNIVALKFFKRNGFKLVEEDEGILFLLRR